MKFSELKLHWIRKQWVRNKTLSIEEYLNKIRPYLKGIINYLKRSDTWKIQLKIAINFISSKDAYEEHVMHSKTDNIKTMINDKVDEVIKELFFFNHFFLVIKLVINVIK